MKVSNGLRMVTEFIYLQGVATYVIIYLILPDRMRRAVSICGMKKSHIGTWDTLKTGSGDPNDCERKTLYLFSTKPNTD
jgi:hypothetical protein